jgi:general secretion pathway protein H
MRRTSRAGRDDCDERAAGFTLIEAVCVMAIIGILAAIILPVIRPGASKPRLQGYAVQIAAILTRDRNAAIVERRPVATRVEVASNIIRSGATGLVLQLPDDVQLGAVLAARCNGAPSDSAIVFLQSGMSCGGSLAVLRHGAGFDVRVNWFTGAIAIADHDQSCTEFRQRRFHVDRSPGDALGHHGVFDVDRVSGRG